MPILSKTGCVLNLFRGSNTKSGDHPDVLEILRLGRSSRRLRDCAQRSNQKYDTVTEPFCVNRTGLFAAIAALTKDVEYCREIKEVISAERHRVENELLGLSLEFVPSQSNFIFAKLPDELDADVICEKMMSKGVIIRSCSAWGYRDCVRITVGKSAENTEMVRVLGNVLEEEKVRS